MRNVVAWNVSVTQCVVTEGGGQSAVAEIFARASPVSRIDSEGAAETGSGSWQQAHRRQHLNTFCRFLPEISQSHDKSLKTLNIFHLTGFNASITTHFGAHGIGLLLQLVASRRM